MPANPTKTPEVGDPFGLRAADAARREALRVARRLSPKAVTCILNCCPDKPGGEWAAGAQAAALARMSPPLMEYAEHVDACYGGRLTCRRGYNLTPLGYRVREELRLLRARDG